MPYDFDSEKSAQFFYQAGVVEVDQVGVVEVVGVKLIAHLVAQVCVFCSCLYDLWRLFGYLHLEIKSSIEIQRQPIVRLIFISNYLTNDICRYVTACLLV